MARRTFCRKGSGSGRGRSWVLSPEELEASLAELKSLMNGLRTEDVGLHLSEAIHRDGGSGDGHNRPSGDPVTHTDRPNELKPAPVTYIDVFENQDVSIGIFIIHKGQLIGLLMYCIFLRYDILQNGQWKTMS